MYLELAAADGHHLQAYVLAFFADAGSKRGAQVLLLLLLLLMMMVMTHGDDDGGDG